VIPEITDDFVEEAASRLADAWPQAPGWEDLAEEDRARFRKAIRVVLVWLRHRPKPH
jgi:hypothetical protein